MFADLTAVLTRYPPTARPSSPPERLGNAGGLSGARLWRFASGQGTLVARCWPTEWPDRDALRQIHCWLLEAGRVGFIPVPIADRDGQTFVEHAGRLWELAPWMPGTADRHQPPRLQHVRAGFTGLAAFHQTLAQLQTAGTSPGLGRRLREVEGWLAGSFDALERALYVAPRDTRAILARRWLDLARAHAPRATESLRPASAQVVPLQPCLRDVRPDHLLFDHELLTGLVDFGAMAVDTVAGDLARLLAEWIGPDRVARAEAIAAYTAVRTLGEAELRLIDRFETANALLGAGQWARWHFLQARAFDDPRAVLRGLERGLERLRLG